MKIFGVLFFALQQATAAADAARQAEAKAECHMADAESDAMADGAVYFVLRGGVYEMPDAVAFGA